tara:strand:+ start:4236 stop:4454 length:219 start_codon:yes stop_codon:yes gene_type:complete
MKRFSIGFTPEELQKLDDIKSWYEEKVGVKVSRCSMIKRLLFSGYVEGLSISDFGLDLSTFSEEPAKTATAR